VCRPVQVGSESYAAWCARISGRCSASECASCASRLELSQEDLAERSGLHRNYIGGIERGERNVAILNIVRVAAGLGITLAEMFAPFDRYPKGRSR
jgi:hypothetical protein